MSSSSQRVAVVTGAAHGIGRAIAQRLHRPGTELLLSDISGEVRQTASELGVAAHVGDLSTLAGAGQLIDEALGRWGQIDVLVNNAGGGVIRPFLEHDEQSVIE